MIHASTRPTWAATSSGYAGLVWISRNDLVKQMKQFVRLRTLLDEMEKMRERQTDRQRKTTHQPFSLIVLSNAPYATSPSRKSRCAVCLSSTLKPPLPL